VEDVGGFFASLKLQTDDASFQRGIGALSGIAGGLKGLLTGGAALAGISLGLRGIIDAANKQGQLLLQGDYLGMSADAISAWSGAVNEAGGSAAGFNESVKSMHRSLVQLYAQGKTNDQMFLNLGLLLEKSGSGISVDKFMGMGTNQQVMTLMNAARNFPDKQKGYEYLLSLLGPDALKTVQYSRVTGKGLQQMYSDALTRIYTGDQTRMGALKGTAEVRNLFDNMSGIWEGFSALAMSDSASRIKQINEWLKTNHENIQKGIDVAVGLGEMLMDLTSFAAIKGAAKGLKEWKGPKAPITSGQWWSTEGGNIGNVFKNIFQPAYEDIAKTLSRINVKIDLSDEAKKLLQAVATAGTKELQKAADTVSQQR
jgi:hypothetical protein